MLLNFFKVLQELSLIKSLNITMANYNLETRYVIKIENRAQQINKKKMKNSN